MKISTFSRRRGVQRTVTVTLDGDDTDFIGLIDQGSNLNGVLGMLTAKIAAQTGLVAERADDRAQAARLLRRAAELLEREEAQQ